MEIQSQFFLEETQYNFGDEEFKEETTIIGAYVLPPMKYKLINGSIIENSPSNEKKRKVKRQEIPIEIEISDNSP